MVAPAEVPADVLQALPGQLPGEVHAHVPREFQRYTSHWDKDEDSHVDAPEEFSAIDHILISNSMAAQIDWVEIDHGHDPLTLTDHFPIIVRFDLSNGNGQNGDEVVKIQWLLPNPAGDERQNEAASIVNIGSNPVVLSGWTLRDNAERTWTLDSLGTHPAGQNAEIMRNGQPMALNNGGDRVDLLNADGTVRDTVTYGPVDEGERLQFQ